MASRFVETNGGASCSLGSGSRSFWSGGRAPRDPRARRLPPRRRRRARRRHRVEPPDIVRDHLPRSPPSARRWRGRSAEGGRGGRTFVRPLVRLSALVPPAVVRCGPSSPRSERAPSRSRTPSPRWSSRRASSRFRISFCPRARRSRTVDEGHVGRRAVARRGDRLACSFGSRSRELRHRSLGASPLAGHAGLGSSGATLLFAGQLRWGSRARFRSLSRGGQRGRCRRLARLRFRIACDRRPRVWDGRPSRTRRGTVIADERLRRRALPRRWSGARSGAAIRRDHRPDRPAAFRQERPVAFARRIDPTRLGTGCRFGVARSSIRTGDWTFPSRTVASPYVPFGFALFDHMSVREERRVRACRWGDVRRAPPRCPPLVDRGRRVAPRGSRSRHPRALRSAPRRVSPARLASEPDALLFDEPFGRIDLRDRKTRASLARRPALPHPIAGPRRHPRRRRRQGAE